MQREREAVQNVRNMKIAMSDTDCAKSSRAAYKDILRTYAAQILICYYNRDGIERMRNREERYI